MAHQQNSNSLRRTPLYEWGIELKARFTSFGGWEMPVQFASISHEHAAVRNAAGMFDISHMGKFTFTSRHLIEQLQTLVPSDLKRLLPGQAQYTVLLNPQGGIIDDVIIYYQGEDTTGIQKAVMIVNAATSDKDKAWLLQNLNLNQTEFQDLSSSRVLIAIQGPQAVKHLQPLVKEDLKLIKAFEHLEGTIMGKAGFIARTGYTGEDGFEVMVEPDVGIEICQSLHQVGVMPCGLGARDTLRLEAAMALYGQDINEQTTPIEAGLSWLVHLDKNSDFIGREILAAQKANGVERRIVGLQMPGRNIARHGYSVFSNGVVVGEVTSGTLSPTLGYPIALAYVVSDLAKVGAQLEVEIRSQTYAATVVKRPFYRSKKTL